jgi:hypothetical protein
MLYQLVKLAQSEYVMWLWADWLGFHYYQQGNITHLLYVQPWQVREEVYQKPKHVIKCC